MNLQDLNVALKVAEFRSISSAAANLDMLTATASAALKRVEKSLGVELFVRTTRHLRLSPAGEKFLPQCQQALQLLDQARQKILGDLDVVEGELRIAVSSDLGRNLVMPWLDSFMEGHPKVSLRSIIGDRNIDFYRDSVDIALRYDAPKEANLYGSKICNVPRLLCASQSYLDQFGSPKHPHDLPLHNGLFYQLSDITHNVWDFNDGNTVYRVKMSGNRASNDGDLVRRWCVSGKGLALKSCLDMSADLLAGRVLNILPRYQPKATELWLICPSRQSITPAVRLLRDNLKQKCVAILQELIDKHILKPDVLE